jgi:hypothetical protein
MKTWISVKQVLGLILTYLRSWQVPFKTLGAGVGSSGDVQGHPRKKAAITDAGLRCTSFDWISTWKATSPSPYGGRAYEAFLLEHPQDSENVDIRKKSIAGRASGLPRSIACVRCFPLVQLLVFSLCYHPVVMCMSDSCRSRKDFCLVMGFGS